MVINIILHQTSQTYPNQPHNLCTVKSNPRTTYRMEETNYPSSTTGVNVPLPGDLYDKLKQIQTTSTAYGKRSTGLAQLCITYIRQGLKAEQVQQEHDAELAQLKDKLTEAHEQTKAAQWKYKELKRLQAETPKEDKFSDIIKMALPLLATGLSVWYMRQEGKAQEENIRHALQGMQLIMGNQSKEIMEHLAGRLTRGEQPEPKADSPHQSSLPNRIM